MRCGIVLSSQELVHRAKCCDCETDEVRVRPADVGHLRSGSTTSINKKFQGGEDGVTSRVSQLVSADVTTEELKENLVLKTSRRAPKTFSLTGILTEEHEEEEEDVLQDEEKKIQEEPSDKKILKLLFLL